MNTLTVSELNARVKGLLESDEALAGVVVSGEISNYKCYPSGHHYFTLKDPGGVLRAVLFKTDAARLTFRPSDGMRVLASGRVSVYPRDGVYQLYCRALMPDGAGALQMAYEELRGRLEAEGLFSPEHKKKLPAFPERVVLITSSAGAAVQDMIRILGRRWPLCTVLLMPVRVQGEEAPGEIAAALRLCNQKRMGDVIITGRGGGSLEDLWAFNDERVARAIFASVIPVVSAVGHEPDFTIADFVADVRAATPSHAAEMTVPDRMEWLSRIGNLQTRLPSMLQAKLQNAALRLEPLTVPFGQPKRLLEARQQQTDTLSAGLQTACERSLQPRSALLAQEAARLDALSPLKVLARGYAVCEAENAEVITDIAEVRRGDMLRVRLCSGRVLARAEEIIKDPS